MGQLGRPPDRVLRTCALMIVFAGILCVVEGDGRLMSGEKICLSPPVRAHRSRERAQVQGVLHTPRESLGWRREPSRTRDNAGFPGPNAGFVAWSSSMALREVPRNGNATQPTCMFKPIKFDSPLVSDSRGKYRRNWH